MIVVEWEDRQIAYREPTHESQMRVGAFSFEDLTVRTRELQATAGEERG
jgi:hypothetical protein